MNVLKNRLFELLEDAVKDARSLDPAVYVPNSERWHEFDEELGICEVCLAGAVIAGTFEIDADTSISPGTFYRKGQKAYMKLVAINHMRMGMWALAYYDVYREDPKAEVFEKLALIPKPGSTCFYGWPEFNAHLDSLELIIPQLREIEVEAPYLDDGTMDTVIYCPECEQEVRGSFDSSFVEGEFGREPTEKECENAYAEFTETMVKEHMEECGTDDMSGTVTIGNLYQSYMRAKEIDGAATDLVLEFLGVEDVRKFVLNQYTAALYGLEHVRLLIDDYDDRMDYLYAIFFQACMELPQFQDLEEFDDAPEHYVKEFLDRKFSQLEN